MLANYPKKNLYIPPFNKHSFFIILLISIVSSMLIVFLAHNIANHKIRKNKKDLYKIATEINDLEKKAILLNNALTINNNSIEGLTTNAALMEQQKHVVSKILLLKPYIVQSKNYKLIDLAAQLLEVNTLYHLAINSDYHNAYKNAHIAKYLIEEQIKSSSSCSDNAENLYYELKKTYSNFPRTYARVIYTLGRSYFYNMDVSKLSYSTKLLRLSNALTKMIEKDTGIATFESALTEQNGLLRLLVDSNEIPKMQEAINRFKYFLNDETVYYDKSQKVVMKYRALSQAELNTKIAHVYMKIASLTEDPVAKKDNYNKALIHMTGGSYDNEVYKGTFNFVNDSSTRKQFYLITLGDVLTLYPNENDYEKVSDILNKYNVNESVNNNLDLAKIAFELSIKFHIFDKATIYLADAECKLAKVFYNKRSTVQARFHINKCMNLQKEIKRPVYHPVYKESLQLKDKILKM